MNSQMPEEMALGFTSDIAKNNLGESFYRTVTRHSENALLDLIDSLNSSLSLLLCSGRPWVPFITTIFLFIFVSNWSGALIPWKLFEIPAGQAHSCRNAGQLW